MIAAPNSCHSVVLSAVAIIICAVSRFFSSHRIADSFVLCHQLEIVMSGRLAKNQAANQIN